MNRRKLFQYYFQVGSYVTFQPVIARPFTFCKIYSTWKWRSTKRQIFELEIESLISFIVGLLKAGSRKQKIIERNQTEKKDLSSVRAVFAVTISPMENKP